MLAYAKMTIISALLHYMCSEKKGTKPENTSYEPDRIRGSWVK